jgi:hypothetical protein
MYPRAARLLFGLIIAPPYPTTTAPVQCVTGNPLGPNNLPASRSKCKACVQHDSRPNNGRSLIDTDGKHYSPKPCKFPSGLDFTLTLSYFLTTSFLKQIQVNTYSSQVTGNHLTSTGLSKLSNYLTADNRVTRIG